MVANDCPDVWALGAEIRFAPDGINFRGTKRLGVELQKNLTNAPFLFYK